MRRSEASRGDGTYPVREEMLTIAKLVATNANNVAPWLRTQEGWNSTPARAAGADAFDFNLYPTGWRLNKNGYGQYGDTAHSWVPLIGSSAKKTWRLNNVKATSNYWFNDNLDAGNPAVGIRCVKKLQSQEVINRPGCGPPKGAPRSKTDKNDEKLKYLLMACCAACVWLAACSDDDYEPLPDWWWGADGRTGGLSRTRTR